MLDLKRVSKHLRNSAVKIFDDISTVVYPTGCRICSHIVESHQYGVTCKICWEAFHLALLNDDIELEFDSEHFYSCSCGPYEDLLRENILMLKTQPIVPGELKRLITDSFESDRNLHDCDLIIPMPLHTDRLEERGFNQAEVIAQIISRISGLCINESSLVKIKKTERHRADMSAQKRLDSLKNVFAVKAPRIINNRTILLVDDIITTGSTAEVAAQTLIEAGAKKIKLFTIARTSSILRLRKVSDS